MKARVFALTALLLVTLTGVASAESGSQLRPCHPHCHRYEREAGERPPARTQEQREQEAEAEAPAEEAPAEEPPHHERPVEEPPQESPEEGGGGSSMLVGVDTGGWSGGLIGELMRSGIDVYRVQSGAALSVFTQAPGRVGSIVFGEGGSLAAIDPTSYAANVLGTSLLIQPQAVEVLNEPGNPSFWSDPSDYAAYATLAKAVHEALATLPAVERPAELCSWDGGEGPNSKWGAGIKAAGALRWCDGVTVHAYGGSSGQDGGAQGGRRNVEGAHAATGLPVYVTEIGWPTAVGQPSTGDSQQWTEAQQAQNMASFVEWARDTGYVEMVIFFNAVDYGSNDAYGIETASRQHKLSYSTLASLSE